MSEKYFWQQFCDINKALLHHEASVLQFKLKHRPGVNIFLDGNVKYRRTGFSDLRTIRLIERYKKVCDNLNIYVRVEVYD